MQRIGFILKVKKDRIEEYKERHAHVWPDMQQALRETGWGNYSLFMREDGLLFGYVETDDFAAAKAGMATREVNARWQAEMNAYSKLWNNHYNASQDEIDRTSVQSELVGLESLQSNQHQ